MAKIRRVIHAVEKPEPKGFDEQYWPILIAIAVLFGFLMGTVLTLLSGIWLWFSLITIPILVFSTTVGLRFVDSRKFKRSTQLALIVSLIVHLAMLLSAHHWYLFGNEDSTADREDQKQPTEKKQTNIPLVFETQQWQQSQTKITPQPVQEKVEQQKTPEPELEKKVEPTPVDKTERKVTQNQHQLRKTRQTVPKQSQTLSKLSRSQLKSNPKSGTRVSEARNNSPQANPNPAENQPAQLTAKNTTDPAPRPTRTVQPNRTQTQTSPEQKSTAQTASIQKRQTRSQQEPTEAVTQTRPQARRKMTPDPVPNQVARSSRSSKQTPRPSARPSAKPVLQPSETRVAQAARNRQTDQPTQQAPKQTIAPRQNVTEPLAARRPTNQSQPKIAQAPNSRPRQSSSTRVPNTTVMEATENVVRAPNSTPQLNPRATTASVSRNKNVSPQQTQVQIQAPAPQTSAVTQSATRASRRPNDTLPSVTPNAPADAQPRRTNQTAERVATNTTVESPSTSTSPNQVAKSAGQPRNTTLTKSTKGTAGVGSSSNVLADTPTSTKPSLVASDSAVRRSATRNSPEDLAFQPVQSAQTRRSMADRATPSAEIKVENSPNARLAGSENPAELNAQSSASQINAASNARTGRVNAAQGSSTLDTGATKLVSETGQGRASGGGQPDIDKEIRSSATQRQRNGQVSNNSLAANLKADVTEAPSELGGGRPSETSPDPNSTSLAKTVAGEGNLPAAGPTAAINSGPTEEASTAPSKSSATLAKAAPSEAAEGDLIAGGGDPDQQSSLRRIRPRLAGGSANTKVTFSGKAYTDLEEGTNADSGNPSSQQVGANDTALKGKSANEKDGVGESDASALLAGGTEKSDGALAQGSFARQAADDSPGGSGDPALSGRSIASSRRQGGPSGPIANSKVELPQGGAPGGNGADAGTAESRLAGLAGQGDIGIKRREQSGGQTVNLDIKEGPGGLGAKMAADTGINSRRARPDSSSIQLKIDTRFQRSDAGGDPRINTDAVYSKGAFKGRSKGNSGASAPSTEPSIELGLAWLANQQRAPGNWSLTCNGVSEEESEKVVYDTPTAATGLALLAFQGAGYNHKEYKYAEVVNRGVQWLINNQQEDGCLYVETNDSTNSVCRLYSHGIAAIALCEAYGMTNDPQVKQAAQKALDYIAASQDKVNGGWRYIPGSDSDTSVTGWMVMALKSGRLAGLDVDKKTLELVDRWLGFAASSKQQHRFRYNPNAVSTEKYPDREVQGKTPTSCMTSVGLLLRLYSGWNRSDPRMIAGAKELLKTMPGEDSIEARNTYYWYYATQVLRHVGGDVWETWYNDSLYPLLIRSQKKEGPMQGSWDPLHPVPDRWGYFSGRLYVTTLNLLTLEVKWRLLPLYEETVK